MLLDMQHNLVSILYAAKGMIEAHEGRIEEGRFQDSVEASAHAEQALKHTYSQLERALDITKKIGWAIKTTQKSEGSMKAESVTEIWGAVIKILKRQTLMNHVEIINSISDDFPKILCNRNDLTEILYCLADNAVQAMEGNGRLILRASLGFCSEGDPTAHFTLADTGPGIPEEILKCLFEPFMTTKPEGKGNGLGLCVVRGLVRKNNGTISVSSFKGCGTTFTLSFSVAKSKEGAKKEKLTLAA